MRLIGPSYGDVGAGERQVDCKMISYNMTSLRFRISADPYPLWQMLAGMVTAI